MKTAVLLLFLAVATVSGDDAVALSRTGDFINGRAWKVWDESKKLGYILGFGDGIRMFVASRSDDKSQGYFGHSKFGEIEDALNDFYRDPANVQIPVEAAMYFFQTKVNGASPKNLAEQLAGLRRAFAAVQ